MESDRKMAGQKRRARRKAVEQGQHVGLSETAGIEFFRLLTCFLSSALVSDEPRQKNFVLNTYKIHALGDYPATIRKFGTTDSFTSEIVSVLRC